MTSAISAHVYEVRPHKDKRGIDLISDVLPFGRLWHVEQKAIGCNRDTLGVAKVSEKLTFLIFTRKDFGMRLM